MRWVLLISLFGWFCVQAQDSTYSVPEIVVPGSQQTVSQFISPEIVKLNPLMNYADLLQKQSGVYIKSQGVGLLSTASFKGLSSINMPVLIDGYGLQSSMNGSLDLSLLSGIHFGGAQLKQEYNDATQTSNLGDAINLGLGEDYANDIASIGYSTLRNLEVGVRLHRHSKKRSSSNVTSIGYSELRNHFNLPYRGFQDILSRSPGRKLSIRGKNNAVIGKVNWQTTLFVLTANRKLPRSLFALNYGQQIDNSILVGNLINFKRKWQHSYRNQLWFEQINFGSEVAGINSVSNSYNLNQNYQIKRTLEDKQWVALGIANENTFYTSSEIGEDVAWLRLRGYGAYKKSFNKSYLTASGQIQGHRAKLYTSSTINYVLRKDQSKFSFGLRKTYRLPVLNELYWYEPGYAFGNDSLQAEQGYALDVTWDKKFKNLFLSINPFAGYYNNLIQWLPSNGIITPINQRRLLNYGALGKLVYTKTFKRIQFEFVQNLNLTSSQYIDKGDEATYKKYQIFTPLLTSNTFTTLSNNRFSGYVTYQVISRNYTATDNSSSLDPYALLDAGFGLKIKKSQLSINCNNILNVAYFTVPNQPLPGLNININFTYNI